MSLTSSYSEDEPELETRLKWHLPNKNSQVFKHKDKNPRIKLIIHAPCNNRKNLELVEHGYIEQYSKKYEERLLNVRSNPNKKAKKIMFEVKMENDTQLWERIAKLNTKLTIKDDEKNSRFYIHAFVDGKRYQTVEGYNKNTKDIAFDLLCTEHMRILNSSLFIISGSFVIIIMTKD